jgi:hypothetical protein
MGTATYLGVTETIAESALHDVARRLRGIRDVNPSVVIDSVVRGTSGSRIGNMQFLHLLAPGANGTVTVNGLNTDVDTGSVPETVAPVGTLTSWHGTGALDTLPLEAVSSDASDSVNGAGANYVVVSGIEAATGLPVATRFALNGTTVVQNVGTAVNFSRIQSAVCYPRSNVGAITVRNINGSTTGTVVASIPATIGSMSAAWAHCPIGYKMSIVDIIAGCHTAAGSATMTLTIREPNGDRVIQSFNVAPGAPYVFGAKDSAVYTVDELGTAIIKATAVGGDNTSVYASMTVQYKRYQESALEWAVKATHTLNEAYREIVNDLNR